MKNKLITSLLSISIASPALAVIYSGGHADIGTELDGTTIEFEFHAGEDNEFVTLDGVPAQYGAGGIFFEPDEVTTVVPEVPGTTFFNASGNIPGLSLTTGDPIWFLPRINQFDNSIPYFGIATEELPGGGVFAGNAITFSLGTVTSPSGSGTFTMWDDSGTSDIFYMNSTNATVTDANNTLTQAVQLHQHFNMGFSEPGIWTVELLADGTLTAGSVPVSGSATYTFQVVPEPSTIGLVMGASILAFVLARRRRS